MAVTKHKPDTCNHTIDIFIRQRDGATVVMCTTCAAVIAEAPRLPYVPRIMPLPYPVLPWQPVTPTWIRPALPYVPPTYMSGSAHTEGAIDVTADTARPVITRLWGV